MHKEDITSVPPLEMRVGIKFSLERLSGSSAQSCSTRGWLLMETSKRTRTTTPYALRHMFS